MKIFQWIKTNYLYLLLFLLLGACIAALIYGFNL